jgi:xanthine dehydrogenase accessory factor
MSTHLRFYQELAQALTQGPVVVATVIQTSGSVPREVGSQLLVCSGGQTRGTIGGGAGEAKVLRQAGIVLQTGDKQQVTIDLSGSPQRQIEGICGGHMQVWLERWQGEAALALAHSIVNDLDQGQPFTLIIPLSQDHAPHPGDAPSPGTVPSGLPGLRLDTTPPTFQISLQPPPTLLIVGAGHCGIQLAKVADLLGFQVVVQDDRPSWANGQNFPQARGLFNQAISEVVDALAPHTQLYAALVTRGFDYDLPALKALLQRQIPCRYIGMIGSKKRVRKALQAIQNENFPPQQLNPLYAPIGLDIGALTPEEIAISIGAELTLVRRGGTGQPLSRGTSSPQKLL